MASSRSPPDHVILTLIAAGQQRLWQVPASLLTRLGKRHANPEAAAAEASKNDGQTSESQSMTVCPSQRLARKANQISHTRLDSPLQQRQMQERCHTVLHAAELWIWAQIGIQPNQISHTRLDGTLQQRQMQDRCHTVLHAAELWIWAQIGIQPGFQWLCACSV